LKPFGLVVSNRQNTANKHLLIADRALFPALEALLYARATKEVAALERRGLVIACCGPRIKADGALEALLDVVFEVVSVAAEGGPASQAQAKGRECQRTSCSV
jgi:hypothetical protein